MKFRVLSLALSMVAVASPAFAGIPSIDVSAGRGASVGAHAPVDQSGGQNSFAKRSSAENRAGRGQPGRDNPVAAVPESQTYALLAAAMCVVIMLSRRRRRD